MDTKSTLNAEISFISVEFKVSNGCITEDKEESNYGRRYRQLKLVTSKANVIEVKRYNNGEAYSRTTSVDKRTLEKHINPTAMK
ncbi:hypothetical protein OS493_024137 [Desmophyllum pertusum]|uniref:Uncharacterized protein n=1 Tax=Desmophyllum pertusum TaxID=174260 RepID=A0A9W9ZB97_9CNID|nr:hypothetical protein OS493_024137 [Desmophyllum pertusum]